MKSPVVVDTDVYSYTLKSDTRAARYAAELAGHELCLCFMTVAELRRWALNRSWSENRRRELDEAIGRCRILSSDDEMSTLWASIYQRRASIGKPIACGDCWIAAAAVRLGVPLISNNAKHYADIPDLRLITHQS